MRIVTVRNLDHILKRAAPPWNASFMSVLSPWSVRYFHPVASLRVIKPFLLADIGEGIRECQIIQWFVEEGARVEQFDKLCEVQSDKASVEITSRFDGVIKKLYYEADDMAIVGKPLLDIDIQSDISPDDEVFTTAPTEENGDLSSAQQLRGVIEHSTDKNYETSRRQDNTRSSHPFGKSKILATPAVRHLIKELDVDISDVTGTGKDSRVLKEDVMRFASVKNSLPSSRPNLEADHISDERKINLTPIQAQMFKTMTRSLSIPHFLYTDSVDLTALTKLRHTLKASASPSKQKISTLAFILKAVSLALVDYAVINARLEIIATDRPQIVLRRAHNFGIAVDTPQGLIVPVIKSVQNLSVTAIAVEIRRLTALARESKLTADDFAGGTFTVSNVGSIGGNVVAPVIVEGQVAILGIGRAKVVPAYNEKGELFKKEECILSWSADHRIVDGATIAKAAELVRQLIEEPGAMLVRLR